ncbi:hypothetical protein [Granulicoccus sp. GXG6511]|uniref:hypothetical protein n=1 Tax=Granulicoccus sp. GXG6511 TaxID=3381351 RepID=UPI003D7D663E
MVGSLIAAIFAFTLRDSDEAVLTTTVPTPSDATTPAIVEAAPEPTPSPEPSPTKRERTGREEPTRTPESPVVQTSSSGSACSAGSAVSAWGSYPVATCRTWKPSTGLLTQAPLRTGTLTVTCQADLQEPNPVYTAGQTNTWWFRATADDGTWDWFPETALAQGATNQPVNGIALCQ